MLPSFSNSASSSSTGVASGMRAMFLSASSDLDTASFNSIIRILRAVEILRGFLLGEAVEGAEAPDQVDGVDADDFAVGEAGGDDVERAAVIRIIEGGDQDQVVGDVEVGVAGREALTFEDHGRGHGEFDDLEGLVLEVAGGAEAVEVLGKWDVILVRSVGLDRGEDSVLVYEAGDVVDVAVDRKSVV